MTMRISQLIDCLKAAQNTHGDLPVYTEESDIASLGVHPCRDGVQRTAGGVPEKSNELVLSFIPAD